jgi:hypothetical protein
VQSASLQHIFQPGSTCPSPPLRPHQLAQQQNPPNRASRLAVVANHSQDGISRTPSLRAFARIATPSTSPRRVVRSADSHSRCFPVGSNHCRRKAEQTAGCGLLICVPEHTAPQLCAVPAACMMPATAHGCPETQVHAKVTAAVCEDGQQVRYGGCDPAAVQGEGNSSCVAGLRLGAATSMEVWRTRQGLSLCRDPRPSCAP